MEWAHPHLTSLVLPQHTQDFLALSVIDNTTVMIQHHYLLQVITQYTMTSHITLKLNTDGCFYGK